MYKSARGGVKEMYFTDDGFAVGVAYCLAILKQVTPPIFSEPQISKSLFFRLVRMSLFTGWSL